MSTAPELDDDPRSTERGLAPGAASADSRLLQPGFLWLLALQMAFGLAFSVFFLLPKFFAQHGASPSAIGLIMALWGIAGVLASPLVGIWIDRIGSRPFALAGALLMAISAFGYMSIETVDVWAIMLRALQGVAFAFVFNAVMSRAADIAPPQRMGQAIGLVGVAALVTNAVSPAIVEPLSAAFGWALGFALAGGMALVAFFVALQLAPSTTSSSPRSDSLPSLMRSRYGLGLGLVGLTGGTGFGAVVTFYQPFALQLDIEQVSGFFVAYTAAALLMRLGLGQVVDRLGRRRMAVASLTLYAMVVLATSWLEVLSLELLGAGLGVAHGVFFPAVASFAMERAPSGQRGKTMTLIHASFNAGLGFAVLGLGALAEAVGYATVFRLTAPLVAAGALVIAMLDRSGV